MDVLQQTDPVVWQAIQEPNAHRQQDGLEMIASENYTSPAVMAAQGSVLTNKYAEGYPGKRYYGGCEHVDTVERLAIDRAPKTIWRRKSQRPAAFRCAGEHGSFLCGFAAWRYLLGDGSGPRRSLDPRDADQLFRQILSRESAMGSHLIPTASTTIRWSNWPANTNRN